MKTIAHVLGAAGMMIALAPTASWAQAGVDWSVTTAPARFTIEPGPQNPPGVVGVVAINLPDQRWLATPLLVYTDSGQAVGSDILWTAPNQPATLVFDARGNAKKYYVYVGSNYPPMHLADRQGGTWIEAREGDGKIVNKATEMRDTWNAAENKVAGRIVTNGIWESGNRFGPDSDMMLHLQAWLDVTAPTHYDFAIMNRDASFLSIDGKELVEWPGQHDEVYGPEGPPHAGLDLAPGRHVFDYYISYAHRPGREDGFSISAVLMVKGGAYPVWTELTGDKPFFRNSMSYHVTAYDLQTAATPGAPVLAPAVAFNYEQGPESILLADYNIGMIALHFTCLSSAAGAITWTFDDGGTAQGLSVDHLFPRGGMRTVRLSTQQGGQDTTLLTQVIEVHPEWPPVNGPQLHPEQRADIMGRDLNAMTASDLVSCIAVIGLSPYQTDLPKLLPALVPKMADVKEEDLPYLRDIVYQWGNTDDNHPTEEIQALRAVIDRASRGAPTPDDFVTADRCRLVLANLLLSTTENYDEIGKILDAIKATSLSGDEQRTLVFRRGDLAFARGDVVGAKKFYGDISINPQGIDARSSVRRTADVSKAQIYLDDKDTEGAEEALTEAAGQSPIDVLNPDWALAKLRLLQDEGRTQEAYLYARRLQPFIEGSARAELLFRLANLCYAVNDPGLGQKSVADLLKKFPYSPEAAEAKQKWPSAS